LETYEDGLDLFGRAQVGHDVGDRVVVFELEEREELGLIEFVQSGVSSVRGQFLTS
jgi:hypothetical protein